MSGQIILIFIFSLLFAGKAIAIIYIVTRKRKKTPTTNTSSPLTYAQVTPEMEFTGPEVIVEDPMTQRLRCQGLLCLNDSYHSIIPVGEEERERNGGAGTAAFTTDDVSTASRSVADLTQPLPVYTIKDQHLEFANVPPPPSFSAALAFSKEAKKKQRKNSTITTISTGSTGGESSPSSSTSAWPFWRTRRFSLPASSGSTAVPLPPPYARQNELGGQEREQEQQEQQEQQLQPPQQLLPVQQRHSSDSGVIFSTSTICPSVIVYV